MKITMFVIEDAIQFNLEPESKTERRFLDILDSFEGQVTLKKRVNIGMCQGGYIRAFGESNGIAIVIREKAEGK